jgi:hypothetical protein
MNREELDDQTKATKNTANSKNIWKWVIGVGIALAIFAYIGGWFNHGGSMPNNRPSQQVVPSDTIQGGAIMNPDTMATDIRR